MVQQILSQGKRLNIELAFVWNRTPIRERLPDTVTIVANLHDIAHCGALDLVVEVCHPTIVKQYGLFLLQHADLLV